MADSVKIQQAALAAEMDTQAFCDMNYKTFEVGSIHYTVVLRCEIDSKT